MNYRVIWEERAANPLQTIYDGAIDKEGLANTVARIGLELQANAPQAGESRDAGERVLFKFPLLVWFVVNETKREAVIFHVRTTRR